jgi:thioredoxin reductase
MYKLIIIDGGPAGMTAEVYAAQQMHALLIGNDIGGQRLPFKLTATCKSSANKYIRKED